MHGNFYVNIENREFSDYFAKNKFARNILYKNLMYLKTSTDVKNLNFFWEKWGNEAVDHKMDL